MEFFFFLPMFLYLLCFLCLKKRRGINQLNYKSLGSYQNMLVIVIMMMITTVSFKQSWKHPLFHIYLMNKKCVGGRTTWQSYLNVTIVVLLLRNFILCYYKCGPVATLWNSFMIWLAQFYIFVTQMFCLISFMIWNNILFSLLAFETI